MKRLKISRLPRPSATFVIIVCFLTSGLLRIYETGAAIAEEVAEGAADDPAVENNVAESCPEPIYPTKMLEEMRNRAKYLDELEMKLASREQVLRVARIRIEDQLDALETAESKLSATIASAEGAAEADINRLTSVYENMKPKEAANIFETMDVEFAAGFLSRMRPDAAAGVMSNLKSETAYAISVIMAGRNAGVPTE